jgi:glycosyltransferase involved in cell wall biosynthesis
MKTYAPIIIFAYNRPEHLKKCLDSLQANKIASESELFVFSDGPKSVEDIDKVSEVRRILDKINSFKKVIVEKSEKNTGLANSVINGVSEVLKDYEAAIVLEDDLIVSEDFLEYMNSSLNFYKSNSKVFSVSGYCAPIDLENYSEDVFFYQRINSWGWGTWRSRWETVDWKLKDFDTFIKDKHQRRKFNAAGKDLTIMLLKYKQGLIDSWAIRFNYACFKQEKLNLYPSKSKINNWGTDDSGTHTKKTNKFKTEISHTKVCFNEIVEENDKIKRVYSRFLSPSLIRQVINKYKILRFLKKLEE